MMGGPPLQDPAIYKDAKAKVKLLEELLYAYDRLEPGLSLTRGDFQFTVDSAYNGLSQ